MLNVKYAPTEPIFYDAWMIARCIVYKAEQEIFLFGANSDYKVKMHSENIKRAEGLIQQRTADWIANYGTEMTWNQYIDGCPRQDYLERILEGAK